MTFPSAVAPHVGARHLRLWCPLLDPTCRTALIVMPGSGILPADVPLADWAVRPRRSGRCRTQPGGLGPARCCGTIPPPCPSTRSMARLRPRVRDPAVDDNDTSRCARRAAATSARSSHRSGSRSRDRAYKNDSGSRSGSSMETAPRPTGPVRRAHVRVVGLGSDSARARRVSPTSSSTGGGSIEIGHQRIRRFDLCLSEIQRSPDRTERQWAGLRPAGRGGHARRIRCSSRAMSTIFTDPAHRLAPAARARAGRGPRPPRGSTSRRRRTG